MAKRKNWFSLFFTNYLGVLNDNFLKTLACFICIAWVGKENESMVVTLASAALVIPYLLFSPLAGRLAKIYKKRKIVVWAKFAEMLIMVVAAAGFLMHSTVLVLSSILLMGLQSALFSPSKYGLIRDIGGEKGISYGSGAMEMFAFVGILTGTLMAAFLSESVTIPVLCVILFGVALLGWLSSLTIRANESEPMKESHETLNPVKFVKDMFVRALAFKGLNCAKEEAKSKKPINSAFLQKLNSTLMRTTGSIYNVMGGSFDSSKGEFRLCGVTAGIDGRSYMSYQKVPAKVEELCALLQEKQKAVGTFREQYELSFNAHLNLVTIHPWVDGNGRTARLLMNYIQFCYNLFPTKIFKEDREEYISALRQSQEEETNLPFLGFMAVQLKKSLSLEIERFKTSQKKIFSFMF